MSIEWFCETCKIRIKSKEEHDKHFNANHDMRVKGFAINPRSKL